MSRQGKDVDGTLRLMRDLLGSDPMIRDLLEWGSDRLFAEHVEPRRRGKARKTINLINAAADILAEIQPATVRAVCYRLFALGIIRDMSKAETNKVSRQLVWAREQGIIPWEWIVDETREAERIPSWADPQAFMETVRRSYRRDHWQHQPCHVEVWSEKGTVRGTLAPVLNDYGVTFRVMHGFASATAVMDVAQANGHPDRFVALYVGDWDPSGLYMSEEDLPCRLEEYGGHVELVRIALTREDIGRGDLPSFPADSKRGNTRWCWFRSRYGSRCWELDAMPPPDLRLRVESAIRQHIDHEAWDRCTKVEAAEQASLKRVLGAWANDGKPRNASRAGDQ